VEHLIFKFSFVRNKTISRFIEIESSKTVKFEIFELTSIYPLFCVTISLDYFIVFELSLHIQNPILTIISLQKKDISIYHIIISIKLAYKYKFLISISNNSKIQRISFPITKNI